MFDIESDRFRNLKYSEHGFKTEAGAVLGEYSKNFAVPSRRMSEALQALAFKKHTYGHTTMGYIDDIKNMPSQYSYSLEFYDRFYRPEYCTLIISGDVKHKEVMAMAAKYFGDWKRGAYVAKVPEEPAQTEARSTHLKFDGDTNMVGIYYKSPAFSDKTTNKLALDLLLEMYFSSNSEIYAELVREKQLVQRFNIQDWDTRDPFIVGVSANLFKVEDTAAVRTRMEQAYRAMTEAPIDGKLLEQLKSRRRYSMAAQLDRPMNVAQQLANYIWLTGDPQTMERYYKMLAKITVADLKKAADTYFVENGRLNISLSKEESAR